MLAQILPGFRDFRTPLITGYLWMAAIWILLRMPIPDKNETAGAMGMINWLNEYTSSAAVMAVLSFVAYVFGILLTVDAKRATRFVAKHGFTLERQMGDAGRSVWKRVLHRENLSYRRSLATDSGSTLLKLLWAAFSRVEARNVSWGAVHKKFQLGGVDEEDYEIRKQELAGDVTELDRRLRKEALRKLSPQLSREMDDEIPVLATKLQEKNAELFGAYDRDRSEAEFRLSIAAPIAFLSGEVFVIGLTGDLFLGSIVAVLGLLTSVVLMRKGWLKVLDSTSVVVTALEIGTISSRVIERLDELPETKRRLSVPEVQLG